MPIKIGSQTICICVLPTYKKNTMKYEMGRLFFERHLM